jgi:hypothetical protein
LLYRLLYCAIADRIGILSGSSQVTHLEELAASSA